MDDLDKFCNIVKKRSEENAKTIKLLYENQLYGNCVGILRQELDSMVRVLFLLTCEQSQSSVLQSHSAIISISSNVNSFKCFASFSIFIKSAP